MSTENVELVPGWFDRWNRGERGPSDYEIDPEVEVMSRFQAEPFRGRDGLRRWVDEIGDQFNEWELSVDELRDAGDQVVVLGHVRVRGQKSGVEFDQPMANLVTVRDGRLLRLEFFASPAEALEAAGLRSR
jgi:ketosteroid isomerase-like protein